MRQWAGGGAMGDAKGDVRVGASTSDTHRAMTTALRYGVGSLLRYVQAAVVRKNSGGGGTCWEEELVHCEI